ncbi:MAG: hypothetical protein ABI151_09990 [Chitinophagaceae bacterium]
MTRFQFFSLSMCLLAVLAVSETGFSQYRFDWRSDVDRIIERSDSLSLKSQKTFVVRNVIRVDRSFKNDIDIRETWHYTIHKGKVVIFDIRYLVDSTEYIENYYLNDNRLICIENYATEFYNPTDANFLSGEVLFIVNEQVKLQVSTGQKKNSLTAWRIARRPVEKFQERYAELKRNRRDVSALER